MDCLVRDSGLGEECLRGVQEEARIAPRGATSGLAKRSMLCQECVRNVSGVSRDWCPCCMVCVRNVSGVCQECARGGRECGEGINKRASGELKGVSGMGQERGRG